VNKLRGQ